MQTTIARRGSLRISKQPPPPLVGSLPLQTNPEALEEHQYPGNNREQAGNPHGKREADEDVKSEDDEEEGQEYLSHFGGAELGRDVPSFGRSAASV